MKRLTTAIGLSTLLFLAFLPSPVQGQTLSYINVDISGTRNIDDFPYAITDDGVNVWMTLFKQGALVKINKATKAVEGIFNNNAIVGAADFYAVTPDGSGNLLITKRDGGQVWKYNIAGNSWTETCITPTISHAKVTNLGCNLYSVDESPGSHGLHTYDLRSEGYFSRVVGGNLYVAGSHHFNFDTQAEAVGVTDVNFAGLYKISPSDLSVTRISIAGASNPRGLAADGNILWVTDQLENKIFKFDTTTDAVLATFAGITQPFGIDASDPSFLFVGQYDAPNIYKISKNDGTISKTVATGHSGGGIYNVLVDPSSKAVYWSGSNTGAVGYAVDGTTTKAVFTTTTNSNHFMIRVGSEIWTAGKGSASIVVMPVFAPTPPADTGGGQVGGTYIPMTTPTIMVTSRGVGGQHNIYETKNGSITLSGIQFFLTGPSVGDFKSLGIPKSLEGLSPSSGTFKSFAYAIKGNPVIPYSCQIVPYLWFCSSYYAPPDFNSISTSETLYGYLCNSETIVQRYQDCNGVSSPVSYRTFSIQVNNLEPTQSGHYDVVSLVATGTASEGQVSTYNVFVSYPSLG